MEKSRRNILIISAIVVVIILLSIRLRSEKPVKVIAQQVESGLVEATVVNTRAGTVKACRRAHVAPAIGGQVATLDVREGDLVKQGQELMSLWNEDLKAQLALAQREVASARNTAREICLQQELADKEARRLVELKKKDLASDEDVDRAVIGAKAKQAACQAAQSSVANAEARVKVAQATLERTYLMAPFAGKVAEVNAEVGEYVTPSPPGIATLPAIDLIDTSCIFVSAPIDEVDVASVQEGMDARITLDAFSGETFVGTVRRVAPYVLELEKQARTVDVEAEFIEKDKLTRLLPGYSADVEVLLAVRESVLRIPTESVIDESYVLVFDAEEQTLVKTEIKPGLSNWKYTEVLSGLSEGDRVVTSVDREGVTDGAYAELENAKD
jgi:HlyD family secretion protein